MATVVPIRAGGPAAITTAALRSGTGVLALEGYLCREAGIACSSAMVLLLRRRPHTIVLDLSGAAAADGATELLDTMRRHAAHHGVDLYLAEVPAEVADHLASGDGGEPFRIVPTVQACIRVPDEARSAAVPCPGPGTRPHASLRHSRRR